MPEETPAAASGRDENYISRRLDRLEQKLMSEDRWWRGGLIAALFFIGIAILVAGHHHRRPPLPPWMRLTGRPPSILLRHGPGVWVSLADAAGMDGAQAHGAESRGAEDASKPLHLHLDNDFESWSE